jgi:3,4-dihydroxy 2-butanone 4-phosphate synthase/GTP cyclohydrolase II
MSREPYASTQEIVSEIRRGGMVVIADDEDRENEGDLVVAARFADAKAVNFMARFGRGLICVPMEGARLDALDLGPMSRANSDPFKTDWSISVDAREGVTTGISAADRARTIEVLLSPGSGPEDLARPGHLFPLRAKEGGVLMRAGHTEASVDLARLAGLPPAAVICEILNDDGTMARLPQLEAFCLRHALKLGTVADLIAYRRRSEVLVRREAAARLPTRWGDFEMAVYRSVPDGAEHVALVRGRPGAEALVRVHSECFTGDVLGSLRCDCGSQLQAALAMIAEEGAGVVLYMRQEGRGIGLVNKLKAYGYQDKGLDTVEANEALGFKPDLRDYGAGAQILRDLGVRRLRLITNNPRKIAGLEGHGLRVEDRVPLVMPAHPENRRYLRTKKEKLGHMLE